MFGEIKTDYQGILGIANYTHNSTDKHGLSTCNLLDTLVRLDKISEKVLGFYVDMSNDTESLVNFGGYDVKGYDSPDLYMLMASN